MSAADPIGALRTLLLATGSITAVIGQRVRALELHVDDAATMPQATIVLKPAGGPGGEAYQDYGRTRVDVICYGATLDESLDVYLAVYPVLKSIQRAKVAGVLLHSASVSSKGATARDPLKEWPVTYSSWLVLAAEIAAP